MLHGGRRSAPQSTVLLHQGGVRLTLVLLLVRRPGLGWVGGGIRPPVPCPLPPKGVPPFALPGWWGGEGEARCWWRVR